MDETVLIKETSKKRQREDVEKAQEWRGYMDLKLAKLEKQTRRDIVEVGSNIFAGVSIFVNGYTEPSAEELKRLMLSNGGTFHHYFSRRNTTHIIASNLPHTKIRNMDTSRIVKASWIVDSLQAKRLLDYTNYLLYTEQKTSQPKLVFSVRNHKELNRIDKESDTSNPAEVNNVVCRSVKADMNLCNNSVEGSSHDNVTRDLLPLSHTLKLSSGARHLQNSFHNVHSNVVSTSSPADSTVKVKSEDIVNNCDRRRSPSPSLFSSSSGTNSTNCDPADLADCCRVHDDEYVDCAHLDLDLNNINLINRTKDNCNTSNRSVSLKTDGNELNKVAHAKTVLNAGCFREMPKVSNTTNPNFLAEFYTNSRLHHISTMGSMFKDYVGLLLQKPPDESGKISFKHWIERTISEENTMNNIVERPLENVPRFETKSATANRIVLHIDLDCFFVSVGLRKRPDLVGKPVAVTHARGNPSLHLSRPDPQVEFDLYKRRIQERDKTQAKKETNLCHLNADIDDGSKEFLYNVEAGDSCVHQIFDTDDLSPADELSSGTFHLADCSVTSAQIENIPNKTGKVRLEAGSSLSEIASCSYEARMAGVKNGMFLGAALQLCPDLQTIPYDFEGYRQVAQQLYDIVASYTRHLEAVSCDELYADVTLLLREIPGATPLKLASCIREHVLRVTGCHCSAGIGPNKLGARLATKLAKPHGQSYLDKHALKDHLKNLPVRELPNVGYSIASKLRSIKVETCSDLLSAGEKRLAGVVGAKTAATLIQAARGHDERPVSQQHVRKSVSAEVNYGIRFRNELDVEEFMKQICDEVSQRLRSLNLQGRCITLKLKVRAKDAPFETAKFMGHGVCDNITKSCTLPHFTDASDIIHQEIMQIIKFLKIPSAEYRGVGVQISRLNNDKEELVNSSKSVPITNFFVQERCTTSLTANDDAVQDAYRNDELPCKLASEQNAMKDENAGATKALEEAKILDVEVLNALPDDIKEQIIREYKEQGYIIPDLKSYPVRNEFLEVPLINKRTLKDKHCFESDDDAVPGCSNRLSSAELLLKINAAEEFVDLNPVAEVNNNAEESSLANSFSQVDNSFLSALPEDIKDELRKDFKRQKNVMSNLLCNSPTKAEIETILSDRAHPQILQLPSPDKRPFVGRKERGKPAKKEVGRGAAKPKKMSSSVISMSPVLQETITALPKVSGAACSRVRTVPSLCGEHELTAVKRLLADWLSSTSCPESEDNDILCEYLCELAREHQLEELDLLLKFLYRSITSLPQMEKEAWKRTYDEVVEGLQHVMVKLYEAPLRTKRYCDENVKRCLSQKRS